MSTRKSLLLQDRLRPSASCRLLELRASPRSSARQRASKGCSRLWLSSQALSRHARSRACFRAVSASRKEAETNSRSTVRLESARAAGESSSRGVPAGTVQDIHGAHEVTHGDIRHACGYCLPRHGARTLAAAGNTIWQEWSMWWLLVLVLAACGRGTLGGCEGRGSAGAAAPAGPVWQRSR